MDLLFLEHHSLGKLIRFIFIVVFIILHTTLKPKSLYDIDLA